MQGREVTDEQFEDFLVRLRRYAGNVSKAARLAGFSRQAAYDRKKEDPEFNQAWEDVIEAVLEDAEAELYRRAVKGTLEPKFYKGEKCGTVRKFSDSNLQFLLKSKRPEVYRDKLEMEVEANVELNISEETRKALKSGYDSIAKKESE